MNSQNSIDNAVWWWAKFLLEKPSREKGMNVNGFRGKSDELQALDKEHLRFFYEILSGLVKSTLEKEGEVVLTTDYEPQGILLEAVIKANVPDYDERFPMKSVMIINQTGEEVKIKDSYGSPFEELKPTYKGLKQLEWMKS